MKKPFIIDVPAIKRYAAYSRDENGQGHVVCGELEGYLGNGKGKVINHFPIDTESLLTAIAYLLADEYGGHLYLVNEKEGQRYRISVELCDKEERQP